MSITKPVLGLCAGAFLAATAVSDLHAQTTGESQRLTVEINKLEESENGSCRAFFLFRNQTGQNFEGFEMSLAILDTGGVIDQLLTIDAAPIPVERTTLKLFEIPDTACTSISEILLHEFSSCKPQNAEEVDCFSIVDLASRASAQLVK